MKSPGPERNSLSGPRIQAALELWDTAGEQHFIKITGRSMLPFLRAGDSVLVKHSHLGIDIGDIIVFQHNRELTAHRVLRMSADPPGGFIYLTKGDNSLCFDPPVNTSKVIGKVIAIDRHGRVTPLDTPARRFINRLIARFMYVEAILYAWGRKIKHKVMGGN